MESNPLHPLVIPLRGVVTHHDWGTVGADSLAARLQFLNHFAAIDASKRYSEFVISTHPSYDRVLFSCNPTLSLREHIQAQVIEVDAGMVDFYTRLHEHGVPYTLKVVSVGQPQSLRVHPGEEALEQLASENPNQEWSAPAKAVMVVALGSVELLFGFQSAQEIVGELLRVPEFADAIGRSKTDNFVHLVKSGKVQSNDMRELIESLSARKRDFMRKCLEATTERLLKMPQETVTDDDLQLIALQKIHPDDPMCFAVYFLNSRKLEAGNAVFIHPEEPYTVLHGNYVEASTCSEHTIFGGLTTQHANIDYFLNSLSYDVSPVEISNGERFSDYGVSFVPPVPQFQLLEFKLPTSVVQQMAETIAPSMILVLDGEGSVMLDGQSLLLPLKAGSVYYLNPQTHFKVLARGNVHTPLHFVQIGVNESTMPAEPKSCAIA